MQNKPTHLYHGSVTQNIRTLEPKKRYVPKSGLIDYEAIYASHSPAFAVAHSFPWSTDEGVNLEIISNKIILTVPKELQERLEAPMSLYKILGHYFEHTVAEGTGYTWHSTQSAPILEETHYPSVSEALEKSGAELIFF